MQFHKDETEKIEQYQNLGAIIRTVISEKGIDILKDTEAFSKELIHKKVNSIAVMQLSLLLEAGNIRNYLTQIKSGITMVDVNNMITCAEEETGLSKTKLKLLLTAMLYGLSLPSAIEKVVIPKQDGSLVRQDAAILPLDQYVNQLKEIKQAVQEKKEEILKNKSVEFERLVNAGVPEALYLKGICYQDGIGTEADMKRALPYFISAAKAGHAEANAVMGDYYFEASEYGLDDYSKAFEYYTQIGAVALSEQRKQNLLVIIASKKQNITQLFLTGILLVVLFIFNQQLGSGQFSLDAKAHWFWAIVSDLLCAATYGLAIWSYSIANYNRTKWAAAAMFIISAICTFFALI